MILSNLHTHTLFCDGENTPREMIKAAIKKGFVSIGFSAHSYTPFDESFCMPKNKEKEYIAEINRLKSEYSQKIDVLLGCECDCFSKIDRSPYDYIIGSCHYIKKQGGYIWVDYSEEYTKEAIKNRYGDDSLLFVKDYYETIAENIANTQPDIIGHFDLTQKFNEGNRLFDEESEKYKSIAKESLARVMISCKLFEINTGAIYKKYRTKPYPSLFLLKELKKRGGEIIFSSDSHTQDSLGFCFKEAGEIAKVAGFRYAKVLTKEGFKDYIID